MKILKSYGYGNYHGVDSVPKNILELFSDLSVNPEKQVNCSYEIVMNALNGGINFNRKFNIDAYEATINKNQAINTNKRKFKECYLDYGSSTSVSDSFKETVRNGGIVLESTSEEALTKIEDAYEKLIDEDEIRYAVKTIRALQKTLFIDEQVDFIGLIQQSLNNIPVAIEKIKSICEKYPLVAEQVEIVLTSGYSFEDCFSLA